MFAHGFELASFVHASYSSFVRCLFRLLRSTKMRSRCVRAGEVKDEKTVIVPLDGITKPLLLSRDHHAAKDLSGGLVHARIRDDKDDKTVKRLILRAPSSISKERLDEAKQNALELI